MSPVYEIDISLPAETVRELKDGGYALYGFKAVKSTVVGAAPLVWFTDPNFLNSTRVTWTDQYQAYISTDQIIPNGTIIVSAAVDVNLGQTANVDQGGNLTPVSDGTPLAISIFNEASTPLTAGISQMINGSAHPMCAIPLHGNMLDAVAPIEKVLLTFAPNTVNTGTVIYKAYASGLLIDLTSNSTRSVSFDVNNGWVWDGGAWAVPVRPNESLAPLLIEDS